MPRVAAKTVTVPGPNGSTLSAPVRIRPNGVYAIDLRKLSAGIKTLKEPGAAAGTCNEKRAVELAKEILRALATAPASSATAAVVTRQHALSQVAILLKRDVDNGKKNSDTATRAYQYIERCWDFFEGRYEFTRWSQVDREHIGPLADHLATVVDRRTGEPISVNTRLNHFNYLKGFFTGARDEGWVISLPVHGHSAIPKAGKHEPVWFELHEMGLLLETSFKLHETYNHKACPQWPWILETEAYTGARENEVLGLLVSDLQLGTHGKHGAGTLRFTHHAHRRLKNDDSIRTFDLWPAHAASLMRYLRKFKPQAGGLLFPKPGVLQVRGARLSDAMWKELRGSMERDLEAANIIDDNGELKVATDHCLRHTYVSARARMFEKRLIDGRVQHAQVTLDTIKDEVGHASTETTRKVYLHSSRLATGSYTELNYARALADYRKSGLAGRGNGRSRNARSRR